MKEHSFRNTNPKHLDCGELIDAETHEPIRPATAGEAARSIKSRRGGNPRGIIELRFLDSWFHAYVVKPEGISVPDWRLAVALKLMAERRVFGVVRPK